MGQQLRELICERMREIMHWYPKAGLGDTKPLPWATVEKPSEESFSLDYTFDELSPSHTQARDEEAESMEDDGSGAHPLAKQKVKEENTKSEDRDSPWRLEEAETQPADFAKMHKRALPLPAAATFISEENGERHEVDVFYAGHGMNKMVYNVKTTSTSSCLFPGRVLKLTPKHDPEPDMIAQLPVEVAPQLHAVKKLFFSAKEGGEWDNSTAEKITWHAWITDWMMPCDFAVNNNVAPFVTVVEHFASFKRLCTYIHMDLYEYIHPVTMLSVICKLYHALLRY